MAQPALREVPVQKQVHEQDEQRRKAVDRRNARLRQVHEVKRQQRRAAQRHAVVAEHPAQQIPHQRQHGHAEQRAHAAPAQRRHTQQRDAERDQLLAERRVRHLVRVHAAQMLIGRACVVDLVKIRAVAVRGRCRHGVRLVAERVRGCRPRDLAHGDAFALRVEQRELAKLQMRARRDAHKSRRRGRGVRRLRLQPFEEVGIALRHRSGGGVGDTVVRVGKGVFARVQAGVVPDGVDAVHAVERERGALAGLKRAEALRVARRAEPRERGDGVHRRQHRDADAAAVRCAPGDRVARGPRQPQKQRQRQRDGRRGQDDPKRCHAPFLPSPERWMLAFVGWSIL